MTNIELLIQTFKKCISQSENDIKLNDNLLINIVSFNNFILVKNVIHDCDASYLKIELSYKDLTEEIDRTQYDELIEFIKSHNTQIKNKKREISINELKSILNENESI